MFLINTCTLTHSTHTHMDTIIERSIVLTFEWINERLKTEISDWFQLDYLNASSTECRYKELAVIMKIKNDNLFVVVSPFVYQKAIHSLTRSNAQHLFSFSPGADNTTTKTVVYFSSSFFTLPLSGLSAALSAATVAIACQILLYFHNFHNWISQQYTQQHTLSHTSSFGAHNSYIFLNYHLQIFQIKHTEKSWKIWK